MISALAISHRLTASCQNCVGQELNLQARRRVGYSHLSTPMLSQRVLSRESGDWSLEQRIWLSFPTFPMAQRGVEPLESRRFELRRFARLRTAPGGREVRG